MSVIAPHVPVETARVRPRFTAEVPLPPESLAAHINEQLMSMEAPCKGTIYAQYGTIYLPEKEQHYWSPQLTLHLEATEGGTSVRGLYGPRASVWTFFIFLYAVLSLATIMVSVIGLSYYMLGKPAQILWLLPLFIGAFLALYLGAQSGQRIGRPQLQTLHHFIEECLAVEKPS